MMDYYRKMFLCIVIPALFPTPTANQMLSPQNNTFASSASLTTEQILQAGISSSMANNIEVALNFERSNWADGSVDANPFYSPPSNDSRELPAGSLLKVQVNVNTSDVNTSDYTIPPNTALSRIMFQTKTLNGSLIPASAYVLWPYTPRTEPDGHPVVGFAHGTSGGFPNCAPSHVRNLQYQFIAPYVLALQGYVVVAPDYAGLGVSRDSAGHRIRHPYTASPAHANDLFYSVQAAQAAFPTLSKRFVLMGHSQGGGAAWGAAQRQALHPVQGYLGAIAGSPGTSIHDLIQLGGPADGGIGMLIANALPDIFPSFDPSTFLTPAGLKLYQLVSEIQGCTSVITESFLDPSLYEPDWYDTDDAKRFFDLTTNGGKRIGGPMLVLQGEADSSVLPSITNEAVNLTCASHPDSQLQYITYAGVTHSPVMEASQVTWLDWIADRFAGKPVSAVCSTSSFASVRPYVEYQDNQNWYIEYATDAYEV